MEVVLHIVKEELKNFHTSYLNHNYNNKGHRCEQQAGQLLVGGFGECKSLEFKVEFKVE